MARTTYINGRYIPHQQAALSVDDRGLQFGDGIYDVVAFKNGRLIDGEEHFHSMVRSLKALNIKNPLSYERFRFHAQELMRLDQRFEGLVYTHVSRGIMTRSHVYKTPPRTPTVMMYLVSSFMGRKPESMRLKSMPDIRWARVDIKSLNLLGNIMSRQTATDAGFDEVVFYNDQGVVTEAGSANLFYVVDGVIQTHPANGDIFNGVTRRRVIQLAEAMGSPVSEQPMTLHTLKTKASEFFMVTTSMGVMPVVMVDNDLIGRGVPGPIATRLRAAYMDFVKKETSA